MDISDFTRDDLKGDPCDDTEHNAVCDGIGKGHRDDGEETAHGVGDVGFKIHLGDVLEHQQADEHQRGSGGERRDRKENRIKRKRKKEQNGGGKRGQTGLASLCNARGGLNIRGDGGGAKASAADGSESVRHQRAADSGELDYPPAPRR